MKHSLLLILALIFIIICIICLNIINIQNNKNKIAKENEVYEYYLDREVSGIEIATLINKAVDQNEKNEITKDEKGRYIENEENSIKIDFNMTTVKKTYPMESFYNKEIEEFVANFKTIRFKCTNIEYHSNSGKVSKLIFEELQ